MVMLPGTDTVLVTKNTLTRGRVAGHLTTFGIATGLTVWTVAAVLGLTTIIVQSLTIFELIKYLGGAYLLYLGVKSFITKKTMSFEANSDETEQSRNHKSCYLQGAMSNILNPKTLVFYMTFLPQFINVHQNIMRQLIVLAMILIICALMWFFVLVYILNYVRAWFMKPSSQKILQKITGVVLIALAAKLVFEKQ